MRQRRRHPSRWSALLLPSRMLQPSEIMSCRLRWRWINNLLWRRNMCKYVIGVAHRMPAAALPDVLL
uniref:Uncharacterized protein n=1 Tax=Setaria italica TaxID=4555 RepID=K3XTX9_SETIT